MSNAPPKFRIVARDGVASAGELQGDYEQALKRRRAEHGPAASTIAAFEYLVRQGDPAELESWLKHRPADEVAQLRKMLLEKCR